MMSASFGSATRHIILKMTTARTRPATTSPRMMYVKVMVLSWSYKGVTTTVRGGW